MLSGLQKTFLLQNRDWPPSLHTWVGKICWSTHLKLIHASFWLMTGRLYVLFPSHPHKAIRFDNKIKINYLQVEIESLYCSYLSRISHNNIQVKVVCSIQILRLTLKQNCEKTKAYSVYNTQKVHCNFTPWCSPAG